MEFKKILKIVLCICIILIFIDQLSKILINQKIEDDVQLIPNSLTITKVQNEGMALGINKQNIGNICLSIIVLVVIFRYIINQASNMNVRIIIFLSLIIAGGISNVIDRIFKGAVFDFIQIGDSLVFNLADCFIVIGWILFVINFISFSFIEIKSELRIKKK